MKIGNVDELKQYEHILFCEEHYNPLGIVRSLGENGINPIGIVIKNSCPITSRSKYFKRVYFVNSIEDGYVLLKKIKRKLPDKKIFIYTSDDKIENYLDSKYEKLKNDFYFFNAGKAGRIAQFQDKYNICEIAKKHGLPLAKTWKVNRGDIPEDISYPIITKSIASTVGGWKDDVYVCYSDKELLEAYKKIKADVVLLQKYIKKKNELEYYGFCVNHGEKTFISISVDYLYLLPQTYSHWMMVYNPKFPEIQKKIAEMMKDIGFEGIFSLEFVVGEDDSLYFLEVNFRNATWSYASTCAGMPLPVLWAKATLKKDIKEEWHKNIKDGFTAMVEPTYLRNQVFVGKVSVIKWILRMRKCSCLYYLNKKDMKPVITWIINYKKGRN